MTKYFLQEILDLCLHDPRRQNSESILLALSTRFCIFFQEFEIKAFLFISISKRKKIPFYSIPSASAPNKKTLQYFFHVEQK